MKGLFSQLMGSVKEFQYVFVLVDDLFSDLLESEFTLLVKEFRSESESVCGVECFFLGLCITLGS